LRFAANDAYVYWQSENATVWRCPPANRAEQTTLNAFPRLALCYLAKSLVIAATPLYWFDTEGTASSARGGEVFDLGHRGRCELLN
jgi:hypothetical protein